MAMDVVKMGAMDTLVSNKLRMLKDLLEHEYNLPKGARQDMEFLESKLSRALAVLRVADQDWVLFITWVFRERRPPTNAVLTWPTRARDLSYVLENEVDAMLAVHHVLQPRKLGLLSSWKNRIARSCHVALTINSMKQRVQIDSELLDQFYDLTGQWTPEPSIMDARISWCDSRQTMSETVGGEEARDELINILVRQTHQEEEEEEEEVQGLRKLAIVGFGGLGKTRLARAVFDRLREQFKFDCTAFVSPPYTRVMRKERALAFILSEIIWANWDGLRNNLEKDEEQLSQEIREFLHHKRYLVVIDDLLDEKVWDSISLCLPSNVRGSRVIVTTRVNSLAEKCCSGHRDLVYEIMPLGYEDSKRLFLQRCSRHHDDTFWFLPKVDEILKICGGLPFAITYIASAIASLPTDMAKYDHPMFRKFHSEEEHTMQTLRSVLEYRGIFRSSGRMKLLTNIMLSFCYSDLPITQRACLLYLAASAKNQRIQRDNLVRKWIAEGLIPEDEGCSREEVASRYFDELINRNVIQPVKYGNLLGKETYEVANLMLLKILRKISQEEKFTNFLSEFEPYVWVIPIRLFIQSSDSEHPIGTEICLTHARSVTMLGPAKLVSFDLKRLEYVRVLDLDGWQDLDNSAMDDICQMILLTYLSLRQTQVTEIPRQVSNLQYLETLDVRQTQVKELPEEVLQLPKLAYLYFGQSGSLGGVKLPAGRGQLKSVKVMGIVDSRECSENAMEEISRLTEVRELEVVLYDRPADKERNDRLLSCIGKCGNLQSLIIHGDSNPRDKLPIEAPIFPLLEKLIVAGRFIKIPGWIAMLGALKKLDIRVCKLEENDMVIMGGLPGLSILTLALVALPRKQVTITSTAGFASLEVFCFDCHVPWISFQEKAMPNLKHLQMKLYAAQAGKFPSGIISLESLKKVTLMYASQYAGSASVTETVALVKKEADNHANMIKLFINGDREIFPPSRSAHKGVTGTEIDMSVNRVTAESEIEEVAASE